jgi:hypothetical protein
MRELTILLELGQFPRRVLFGYTFLKNRSQFPLRGNCCLLSTSLLLTSSKGHARSVYETFFMKGIPEILRFKEDRIEPCSLRTPRRPSERLSLAQ